MLLVRGQDIGLHQTQGDRLQAQTSTKQGLSVEELSVMKDDARPQTQDVQSMREEEMKVNESGELDAARLLTQDMTMSVAELSVQGKTKPKTLSVAEYHPTETSQMSEEITCRVQGLNENELGVQGVSGGAEPRLSLAPALRTKKVPDVQDDVRPKTGQLLVSVAVLSQSEMLEMEKTSRMLEKSMYKNQSVEQHSARMLNLIERRTKCENEIRKLTEERSKNAWTIMKLGAIDLFSDIEELVYDILDSVILPDQRMKKKR